MWRGEAIGLKWDAVDFKNNKIKINHTIVQSFTIVAKDKTTTTSSKCEYQLFPEIKKMLLKIKDEQKHNKKLGQNHQNLSCIEQKF